MPEGHSTSLHGTWELCLPREKPRHTRAMSGLNMLARDSFTESNTDKLEMGKKYSGRYHNRSSDTDMLNHIGRRSLEMRRVDAHMSMMYMMSNGLVAVDTTPAITQCNKHVIITSKRCFYVTITCLLRCVFAGMWYLAYPLVFHGIYYVKWGTQYASRKPIEKVQPELTVARFVVVLVPWRADDLYNDLSLICIHNACQYISLALIVPLRPRGNVWDKMATWDKLH